MSNNDRRDASGSLRPLTLDIKRTGRLLSLGRTKVFQLLATGELTKVKIGRRTLVTAESIEALVARSIEG